MKRKAVVFGAGGFIGSHLVKKLKDEGCWVRGVDLKYPEYSPSPADEFIVGDLRVSIFVSSVSSSVKARRCCILVRFGSWQCCGYTSVDPEILYARVSGT